MSLPSRKFSSVDALKRHAKKLKSQSGVSHTQALDAAAREAGFQNFVHARRQLERGNSTPTARASSSVESARLGRIRPIGEFHKHCASVWIDAVERVTGGSDSQSFEWTDGEAILRIVSQFIGPTSHVHFPSGGGHDFQRVRGSQEKGCIEFEVEPKLVYVAKPGRLTLDVIQTAPAESFVTLELQELKSTGVYEVVAGNSTTSNAHRRLTFSEPLVDLGHAEYVGREVWYDDGREDPLPDSARLVHRLLKGNLLLVAKGSRWNGAPRTYTGIHDELGRLGVRRLIEQSLAQR